MRGCLPPRDLDVSCGHNAHVVVKGDGIVALKRDGQIARQLRMDAAIIDCIRDGCVIQCKGLRGGVVRRRALAAFEKREIGGTTSR